MSAVDVLAVLDALNGNTPSLRLDADVKRARAAVAELIEAATACVENGGQLVSPGLAAARVDRLRAALARCKGGEG